MVGSGLRKRTGEGKGQGKGEDEAHVVGVRSACHTVDVTPLTWSPVACAFKLMHGWVGAWVEGRTASMEAGEGGGSMVEGRLGSMGTSGDGVELPICSLQPLASSP